MKLKKAKTSKMLCIEIPVIDYNKALDLQRKIVAARNSGIINEDIILLVEHPSVFTLGRRGGLENLTVSKAFATVKSHYRGLSRNGKGSRSSRKNAFLRGTG